MLRIEQVDARGEVKVLTSFEASSDSCSDHCALSPKGSITSSADETLVSLRCLKKTAGSSNSSVAGDCEDSSPLPAKFHVKNSASNSSSKSLFRSLSLPSIVDASSKILKVSGSCIAVTSSPQSSK